MWIVKKLFLLSGASAREKTKTLFCLLMMSCMVRTLGARKVNPYSVLSQGILATMEHLPPGTNWSRQSGLSHTNVWTIYRTFDSSLFRLIFGQNCPRFGPFLNLSPEKDSLEVLLISKVMLKVESVKWESCRMVSWDDESWPKFVLMSYPTAWLSPSYNLLVFPTTIRICKKRFGSFKILHLRMYPKHLR